MELLNKLQESGLTKREAQIYLALLQKKEFAASEIASIVTIGRTKIYEIIPNLVAKGLCSEIQKDGKKIYCSVEPKIALKNLLAFFQREYDEVLTKKEKLINELEVNLGQIYSKNAKKSDNLDYIEVIKDRNQIRNKWLTLQKNLEFEELVFNKAPYSITPVENIEHEREILDKKIVCKGIYECENISSESAQNEFIKMLDMYSNLGEIVKVIEKLPMKLAIIDEKITMLALNDPVSMKPSITTVVINHPSFAIAQKEVFESYWNKAIPFDDFKKNLT